MKLVYLTSGAAGMYCGSCMHDNALARALTRTDTDVILAPTYTPIRTDEEDISLDRVFFGGISVFLQQKIPLFRVLPSFMDRWLDQPWLIRMATAKAAETDPKELGALTVSMLQGRHGRQRKEVGKLIRWLKAEAPDVVLLSNMLIAGCVPAIKDEVGARVVVTLQGDDIFLRDLPAPYEEQAVAQLKRLAPHVDQFIAHSEYYADYMSEYLTLPRDRIAVTPLCIDVDEFANVERGQEDALAIGYLARLAPEKGLHNLVDAFIDLHSRQKENNFRLRIAGWLGSHNVAYAEAQFERLRNAGLGERFEYVGSVDRAGKLDFLKTVDVISVPTDYHEPKGLFVLESLAAGIPVVQPAHGAFPELLRNTGGGLLYPASDNAALADGLFELLANSQKRRELAEHGRRKVVDCFNSQAMAEQTLSLLRPPE